MSEDTGEIKPKYHRGPDNQLLNPEDWWMSETIDDSDNDDEDDK